MRTRGGPSWNRRCLRLALAGLCLSVAWATAQSPEFPRLRTLSEDPPPAALPAFPRLRRLEDSPPPSQSAPPTLPVPIPPPESEFEPELESTYTIPRLKPIQETTPALPAPPATTSPSISSPMTPSVPLPAVPELPGSGALTPRPEPVTAPLEVSPFPRTTPRDAPPLPALVVPPATIPPEVQPPGILSEPYLQPRPLPGSPAFEYPRELEARSRFRTYIWDSSYLTALPTTLLWESPLAVSRDPRMRAMMTNLPNFRGSNSLETSIGGTIGLFRYEPAGTSAQFQVDIFGVVHTRLSPEDVTLADYRFGFPLTFQWNDWQGKIAYEHTSAHLGDRLIRGTGLPIRAHAKDELVLGLGRWVTDQWRVYVHAAYAFIDINPDGRKGPFRGDIGFEWYSREATGFRGTPFVAANVEWRQDQNYTANYVAQAGWLWRNPFSRLGAFRLYAEYHRGLSQFGQFYRVQENYAGVGIAFDY